MRPTTLTLEKRYCPAAVGFYESGAVQLPDVFHVGTAAHSILERLGNFAADTGENPTRKQAESLSLSIAETLASKGRVFEGMAEPPLPWDAVVEGRELALDWHALHGLSPTAKYELGIAFAHTPIRSAWSPVAYSAEARFRLILDVLDVLDEDDEAVVVVRDYKSSWTANRSYLDHLQQRAQAIAGIDWARHRGLDPAAVRIEVGNLRTRAIHARTLHLAFEEDAAILAGWRDDLSVAISAAATQRELGWPARPGIACNGCPYVQQCQPAAAYAAAGLAAGDPTSLVAATHIYRSLADVGEARLRRVTDERPIVVDGGQTGYGPRRVRLVTEEAPRQLAQHWLVGAEPSEDSIAGLLRVLRPSVAQLERVAKAIYGRGELADDLVGTLTRTETRAEWQLHSREPEPGEQAEAEAWRRRQRVDVDRSAESAKKWGFS